MYQVIDKSTGEILCEAVNRDNAYTIAYALHLENPYLNVEVVNPSAKQNRFNTLVDALSAEGIDATWPDGVNMSYNSRVEWVKDGMFYSITRFNDGKYERPLKYKTGMGEGYTIYSPI